MKRLTAGLAAIIALTVFACSHRHTRLLLTRAQLQTNRPTRTHRPGRLTGNHFGNTHPGTHHVPAHQHPGTTHQD